MSQFFPSGGGSGGGGATIPATTNLIKGDNAGNGADSRIVPSTVILGAAGTTANAVMVATGSNNTLQPAVVKIDPVTGAMTGVGSLRASSDIYSGTVIRLVDGQAILYSSGNGVADFLDNAGQGNCRLNVGSLFATTTDAATNTVATVLTSAHATSGFSAQGFGVAHDFILPSDAQNNRVAGRISTEWNSSADGNEISIIRLLPMFNGAQTGGLAITGTELQFNNLSLELFSADTGWTANADGGDKTSVIPANATLDAMQAALNIVVAGFGDAFVAVADKCKAIETAFAGNLVPNA